MGMIDKPPPMHRARWVDVERDYLRTAAADGVDIDEICLRLGRSRAAVHEKALRLGLRVMSPHARASKEAIMATIAAKREQARNLSLAGVSLSDIARRLNRSTETVKGYLRAGNVPTRTAIPMTEEIRETVRKMYPTSVHINNIVQATGRTQNSIIGLAHRMGLRRPERARTWA